jgi:predicted nucleotidyltransferase
MPYGLSQEVLNKITDVFEKSENIQKAILFGSRAKGTQREGSDIDIALKGNQLNHDILKKIELKIDELWLPYEVNLVIYDSINNTDLKEHIERSGIRIYENEEASSRQG